MFIVWQAVVLVGALSVVTGLILVDYARAVQRRQRDRLNDVATLIVNQMEMQNENPPGHVAPYKVFVIDAEDGSYVFPRPEDSEEDRALWESHRVKLIYQMQKRRQGWIVYPEGVHPTRSSYHVLRYLSMKTTGWIVVVEAVFPSQWHFIREVGNKDLLLKILTVVLFALFFIKVLTGRWFAVMKKVIADSLESNLMNMNHEEIWGRSSVDGEPSMTGGLPVFSSASGSPSRGEQGTDRGADLKGASQRRPAEERQVAADPINSTIEDQALPDPFPYEETPPEEVDSASPPLLKPSSLEDPSVEKRPVPQGQGPSPAPVSFDPGVSSEEPGRRPQENDMKIDVRGIRSPVLRKMIEELRNKD